MSHKIVLNCNGTSWIAYLIEITVSISAFNYYPCGLVLCTVEYLKLANKLPLKKTRY